MELRIHHKHKSLWPIHLENNQVSSYLCKDNSLDCLRMYQFSFMFIMLDKSVFEPYNVWKYVEFCQILVKFLILIIFVILLRVFHM